ncbi:MAG: molybdopterin-binding protein [Thermoproteota archaeon]|nr:molybdopterin-binding protein [Thermoproteota archaeon]
MSKPVEIICVGNELLIGKVLNTNAHWLAKRITSLGLEVRRITTVRDEVEEISHAVQETMKRKPKFVITTGGLGPTFDDKTLKGVAEAFNCKLKVHSEALEMVKERYRAYVKQGIIEKFELTSPREKMAKLPENSVPFFNPVGTAPGVMIKQKDTTLIALPGVPSEMKETFERSVAPLLKQAAEGMMFFEAGIYARCVGESEIAPLIERVMHDNPCVYVKSHPKGGEKISRIEFHFSTTAKHSEVARQRVSRALTQLSEMIREKGGKIKPMKTKSW